MKKLLLIILVLIMAINFSACKKVNNNLSNIESDLPTSSDNATTETDTSTNEVTTPPSEENKKEEIATSSEEPVKNNEKETSNTVSSNVSSTTSTESIPTLKKMIGTWSLIIPENMVFDMWHASSFLFVYDIMIFEDCDFEKYYIKVAEKEYIRSDTETYGEVKYFDNQRYTLANSSIDLWNDFDGEMFSAQNDDNTVIFEIEGYELERGRFYIEETHYFTLIDDTHLQWNNCEIYTEFCTDKEQYFPWNTSTIFTKQ